MVVQGNIVEAHRLLVIGNIESNYNVILNGEVNWKKCNGIINKLYIKRGI